MVRENQNWTYTESQNDQETEQDGKADDQRERQMETQTRIRDRVGGKKHTARERKARISRFRIIKSERGKNIKQRSRVLERAKEKEEQERGNQEREPDLNGETEMLDETVRVEGPGHREEKGWRAGCGRLERRWEAGVGKGEVGDLCLVGEVFWSQWGTLSFPEPYSPTKAHQFAPPVP